MKILFATDGRKPSFQAERCVTSVGDSTSLDITVLTVGDSHGRVVSEPGEMLFDKAGLEAALIADAASNRLRSAGFSVRTQVLSGSPSHEIARASREGGFDLALVGAAEPTRAAEASICPLASGILKSSSSSVLLARGAIEQPAAVLFWQDGSNEAAHALDAFLDFADPDKCTMTVVAMQRKRKLAPTPSVARSRSNAQVGSGADPRVQELADSSSELIKDRHFSLEDTLVIRSPSGARAQILRRHHSIVVCGVEHVRWLQRFRFAPFGEEVCRKASAVLMATSHN